MWFRLAVVLLVALPWAAPAGAASMPTDLVPGGSVNLESVIITAGSGGSTSVEGGQPAIDFRRGSAGGLSPGMLVVIGDPTAPASDHAFGLENRGEDPAEVAFNYEYDREPSGDAGVSFAVYDATGTRLADGDGAVRVGLRPGARAYVVVTISTHGATPADDLSGTIEFSVTARGPAGQ